MLSMGRRGVCCLVSNGSGAAPRGVLAAQVWVAVITLRKVSAGIPVLMIPMFGSFTSFITSSNGISGTIRPSVNSASIFIRYFATVKFFVFYGADDLSLRIYTQCFNQIKHKNTSLGLYRPSNRFYLRWLQSPLQPTCICAYLLSR